MSFHYICGKISRSTIEKQSKPWGLNQPTATVTLHPINLLWILCRDVLWWKSSGPFLTLPVVSSVTQAGGLCRITQWYALAVSDVCSYYFMGTFLTGPLLTASSQSVPSIVHLPSLSQESPSDDWVCLSWLLRAKCWCLNSFAAAVSWFFGPQIWWESRFLRVFLSVWFYEPWGHDSCVWVTSKSSLWFTAADKGRGGGVGVCRQLFVMSSGQPAVRPWFVCYAGSFSLFAPLSMWPFHSHGSKLQACINSLCSPLKRGVHPTLFMTSSIPAALLCKLWSFRGNIFNAACPFESSNPKRFSWS